MIAKLSLLILHVLYCVSGICNNLNKNLINKRNSKIYCTETPQPSLSDNKIIIMSLFL